MAKAKILLVDDTQPILDQEMRILSRVPGVEIATATTGTAALKHIVTQHPDIVFLDLMLPDLSGEQICRVIKTKPDLQDIAVIIVTAKDDPGQLERAFAIGCDAYVTKPFQEEDLVGKVQVLLSEKGIDPKDGG